MIHYHISSYFLRKLTFSKAINGKDVLFLFEVTFICPAGFAGYQFVETVNAFYFIRKSHGYGYQMVIICWSTNIVTSTVEFTSRYLLLHLKWYIFPSLVSGYYFSTLVQQKLQLLRPRPNVKMFNHVSTC